MLKLPQIINRFYIGFAVLVLSASAPPVAQAQQVIKLYPGIIPNARQSRIAAINTSAAGMYNRVVTPELEMYLPEKDKATGAAVIVCPGGSYKVLVYEAEGVRTAKELAKNGIAAFVLKYRLPNDSTMVDKTIGPLQDGQQAIKMVRQNAKEWNIDTARVGIMGFSAGGHLASTVATHFKKDYIENNNHTNLRPSFLILVYPVISMQDNLTHKDSRTNLLGTNPTKQTIDLFSNELQVDANTPPGYITHAGDDKLVDVDNSIAFFEKLRHNTVPAELHLYAKGGHGFVLKGKTADWMLPLFKWMQAEKLIN